MGDDSAPDWYRLDDLPAGSVHGIVARWDGYAVSAATATDKKGRRTWYEVRGRDLVPIVAEVKAWRPADGIRWRWPNGVAPHPLPRRVWPRVASIGGVEFSATDAAAEMEAERDALRREPEADVGPGQWWRDVARVVYEPMGSVTFEMGEARIMRALILERSIRMDMTRPRTNAAVLADLKVTLADVLAEQPSADWVPPLVAMPEDWRDFETVMGWLVEVMPSRRELFVLRARMLSPPATWVQIGDEMRRSPERARQVYTATVGGLVEAANRPPRRAPARLAALQERNREARRA